MVVERSGIIVFVSTLSAAVPSAYLAPYTAPKAAVNMLANSLALEYAQFGVTVQNLLTGKLTTSLEPEEGKPLFLYEINSHHRGLN